MSRNICVLYVISITAMTLCFAGCGPSAEERTVIKQFNQLPELIEKGLYVKKIDSFVADEGKVFEVDAELVNEEGIAVGRVKSERVEGFGTRKPRILMYETPGVSEEWDWDKYWEQNPGRRRGGGRRGGDQQNKTQEGEAKPADNKQ